MSTPTFRLRRVIAACSAMVLLGTGGAVATLGLAAVNAAPAGATSVATESEFRDAWANDAEITLTTDITLTCDGGGRADRDGTSADFVLDGQGHTITQTCAGSGVLEVGSRGGNGVVRAVTLTGGSNTTGGEYGAGSSSTRRARTSPSTTSRSSATRTAPTVAASTTRAAKARP